MMQMLHQQQLLLLLLQLRYLCRVTCVSACDVIL
jgi:hypothetical protein